MAKIQEQGCFMSGCRRFLALVPGMAIMASVLLVPDLVVADNALVLPDGVSRGYIDFYRYLPTTKRYNGDGEREEITTPFSNATIDNTVLNILPSGAILGDVSVDYEYDIDVLDLGYAYGVNENLSIGFHMPYYWISNNVATAFNNSNANVGLDGIGACCIPIGLGGMPLVEQDLQDLIGTVYGFSEIDDWKREGIGDIELGAKYRFYLANESALALTGGLRIPTGYEDDADKLDDVAWSYGNYAILMRLHYDYLLSNVWRDSPTGLKGLVTAAGDVVLNLTLRYDYMLPDDRIARIGNTPDDVFTNNRERVDRKLGDLYNVELSVKYQATDALAINMTYTYTWKSKDDISGDMGFNYSSLEANTDSKQEIIIVEMTHSTLAAYREKASSAPMEFSIAYRERFDGEGPRSGQANPILYTRWVVVSWQVLF